MGKRGREEGDEHAESTRDAKRIRPASVDHMSRLSNELLLKVLSFLPVSELIVCQRISHKYHKLAGDGQLWKSHYYNRFVRPRASRLPGLKELGAFNDSLNFASKASRWLDEDHLVKSAGQTDFKKQYKLRHNWTKGSPSAVNAIPVSEEAAIPPILVQMHGGIIYTVDHADGLRAWSAKGPRDMIAQLAFPASRTRPPTALAVDATTLEDDNAKVVVGFEDGSFGLYLLNKSERKFCHGYFHEASSNGVVSSVALAWPYAVTMTATQLLSLYRFDDGAARDVEGNVTAPPRLLHSLKSHTVWSPLSTSLRTSSSAVFICVAYALPTYLSGWTVGIQEVTVSPEGKLLDSRLASAIDQHYRPLAFTSRPVMHHLTPFIPGTGTSTALELRHIHSKPTSLSYTHPYLLVSHPDNTLTLYLVTSTTDSLSVSAGSRLWGHTSSVSGAQVCRRGKAVSVSRRGDELRVWELEGGFSSTAARKRLAGGDLSVQIKPERKATLAQSGFDLVAKDKQVALPDGYGPCEDAVDEPSELTLTRGWIGFDDENVVVLKEQSQGKQALVIYDFT
ncbi:f-box domain-containing [Lecanosticta acicola]|uniref:F-box domain-containing n=1 Tax=Lecanosticta acicola TaxID=111012 RepID=A0AAI8YTU7_9PEZI|nr:f-box domain-containing [Lecanosticta acicola]